MKLIYKGKYNGDPQSIPCKEHIKGAVKFKEPETVKELSILANSLALVLSLVCMGIFCMRAQNGLADISLWGCIAALAALFPHEILHALCFKEEVYLYTNLKQGMLFVTGPETMSKARFVFLSMLPNIVFGFIPFLIFIFMPDHTILGTFGAINVGAGCGDYLNVFNALTQMPKGARTYMHHFNSYWYMPDQACEEIEA